jgi:uncharacterized membrane protein HdeD (DUF308 family)
VFGICFTVAGLLHWLNIPLDKVALPSWLVPAAFIALGVAIVVSGWARRNRR